MSDLISRQTAIDLVRDVCDAVMSGCNSWYDPETDDEVYKDIREVDAILKCNKEVRIALRNMPSAQPEIIRCKDCYYCISYKSFDKTYYLCDAFEAHAEGDLIGVSLQVTPDHYCSWAERKQDATS